MPGFDGLAQAGMEVQMASRAVGPAACLQLSRVLHMGEYVTWTFSPNNNGICILSAHLCCLARVEALYSANSSPGLHAAWIAHGVDFLWVTRVS
jgi:hypothetical protein